MTVGERIKYYRKKSKITQKKLSELTGLAEITIRQYEADKYTPKYENIQKISNALNIPIDAFIPEANQQFVGDKLSMQSMPEKNLLYNYRLLNKEGQKKVDEYIDDLLKIQQYLF